ncbi:glutathione S-transferase family protein [Neorhizobium sp. NCHU2750]|uniref:glutathione S-transferase family protein n=1 Tax=Neorhizobium sp. NCHU2750 TaxID=1825976 RepID=UPI000E71D14C|nr:glutathione S-transferase [Neorhizobium sp. NCHU2750]
MLKIYGVYRSRATRPLWLVEEIGLPFEHIPIIQAYRLPDTSAPGCPVHTRSDEFLAVNPMGSIPSIDDDGFVLHESLAISIYLARKYGGDLGPKNIEEAAQMVQWALFAATSIETPALKIQSTKGDTPEGIAAIDDAAAALVRPFDVLEKHLVTTHYMVGDRFTAADINVIEILRYARGYHPLFDARPSLKAWYEACTHRPAYQSMWAKRNAEPA